MDKNTSRLIGAALGGAAAAAAFTLTGPWGLVVLASALGTIDAGANLGGAIAEASYVAEPSCDIKITVY